MLASTGCLSTLNLVAHLHLHAGGAVALLVLVRLRLDAHQALLGVDETDHPLLQAPLSRVAAVRLAESEPDEQSCEQGLDRHLPRVSDRTLMLAVRAQSCRWAVAGTPGAGEHLVSGAFRPRPVRRKRDRLWLTNQQA
jgi:hypothetical protein